MVEPIFSWSGDYGCQTAPGSGLDLPTEPVYDFGLVTWDYSTGQSAAAFAAGGHLDIDVSEFMSSAAGSAIIKVRTPAAAAYQCLFQLAAPAALDNDSEPIYLALESSTSRIDTYVGNMRGSWTTQSIPLSTTATAGASWTSTAHSIYAQGAPTNFANRAHTFPITDISTLRISSSAYRFRDLVYQVLLFDQSLSAADHAEWNTTLMDGPYDLDPYVPPLSIAKEAPVLASGAPGGNGRIGPLRAGEARR